MQFMEIYGDKVQSSTVKETDKEPNLEPGLAWLLKQSDYLLDFLFSLTSY